MSTATIATPAAGEAAGHRPYRMSYEMYERLGELGLFRAEDHITLLDGILVQAMTKGPGHSFSLLSGQEILRAACPPGWHVRPEQPIAIRDGPLGASVPEPDLSIVSGTISRYRTRHPEAHEVGLIVEVATTPAALAEDRAGLRRYAAAGIPTVWIVALADRSIYIHTEPSGPSADPGYGRVEVKRPGELFEVPLGATPDQAPAVLGPIAVASFFPPTA